MNDKPLVYIAGPYTKGDPETNTLHAIACGEMVIRKGGLPLIPHLSHYWDKKYPKPLSWWYSYDRELLKVCDCVVRLMGESEGADKEVLLATELRKPVYSSSEVWCEDFYFPCKKAFQSYTKLAT